MKIYMFEYDPINCCQDCPFFYDYICCEAVTYTGIEDWRSRQNEIAYTWDGGGRPVNCPLLEVVGPNDD